MVGPRHRVLLVLGWGLVGCGDAPNPHHKPAPDSASPDTDAPAHTDTGEPGVRITDHRVGDVARMVTAKQVSITTDHAADIELRCVSDQAFEEDHVLTSVTAATTHQLELTGLLPDTRYTCIATAARAGAVDEADLELTTAPLPFAPLEVTVSGESGIPGEGAYSVLSHWSDTVSHQVLILDWKARVRWYWNIPDRAGIGVEAAITPDGNILVGGGFRDGLAPTVLAPSGDELWVGPPPTSNNAYHHDVQLTPDGSVLTLSKSRNTDGVRSWQGFRVELVDQQTDEVTWQWDSQRAVDEGLLPVRGPGDSNDLYHANGIGWLDDAYGSGILVSLPRVNAIYRIAYPSGEVAWRLGPRGDFALLDPYGDPITDDSLWFYGQHAPQLQDGRILIYDNGTKRPRHFYSRALEMQLDETSLTATATWQYLQGGWWETTFGSVDWLDGDHVLIGQGHDDRSAATPNFRSAVIQVDRATKQVVHEIRFERSDSGIYRAHRIDGCAIFHNRAYCPDS